jgi:DNA-binding NtrC family response regulator
MNTARSNTARLLAIDDSADSAELVARIAVGCGYEAQATSDPDAVRDLVSHWKPEVLTLDLCMPETDGINLLAILADSGFDGRLVIISGQDRWFRRAAGRLAEIRGLKVADEFEKPVNIEALRQLLRRLRQEN